jgi:AsmA protein
MTDGERRRWNTVKIVGIASVPVLALIIAIPWLFDADQFRPILASELSRALGREVKIGNLSFSPFSGEIAAKDISIGDDPAFSKAPFVQAKSLRIGVELRPLIFSRALHVNGISLNKPEITLIRSTTGDWNFSRIGLKSGGSPSGPAREKMDGPAAGSISIRLLKITGGRVTVMRGSESLKPFIYDKVDIDARNLSFSSVFPFSFRAALPGGGRAEIEGQAGPMDGVDASLTPVSATLAVEGLDLVASGIAGPDSGLSALIDFRGSISSDGKQMQSKGSASVGRLRILKSGSPAGKPVSVTYRLHHDFKSQSGVVAEGQVECGKAVARLSGSYNVRGNDLLLVMKLRGENMPAQDLISLLPAVDVTLPDGASLQGGSLTADLLTQGSLDKLVTSGMVGIYQARLSGFDLGTKIAAVASLAGIRPSETTGIEKFTSELRVAPDGIQVSRLVLIVPALGELTGYGTISSGHSLDFKMLATLNTTGSLVNRLTRLAGLKASEFLNVPFLIGGTTANPTFTPDVQGIAGKILGTKRSGKEGKSEAKSPSINLENTSPESPGNRKK